MRKKKSLNSVRKPNALLYYAVVPVMKIVYRLVYGHTVDKANIIGLEPPYLVVAGHASWLDYIITSTAMFPVRMNYVGAYNFFRDKLLRSVMTFMGVIPKFQFSNDLSAIKQMKYCVEHGRVVALFPHGCLSNDGRPGGFAVFGVAKLVKLLAVPVVALQSDGAYLTRPRWSKKARRGKIETHATLLFSTDEVKTLSNMQIYQRMMDAIYYDDYRWQRKNMIPFHGSKVAEGVEFVLYKCPKCKSEFTLRSENDRMFCISCGNAVHMNEFLLFEPESSDSVFFDGLDKWFDYQLAVLQEETDDPMFCMKANTLLQFNEPERYGYQDQGHGEVTLTRDGITYSGMVKDEMSEIVLPMKSIPMIPFAADEYIEVAAGKDIYRFILEDKHQMIKWVMAVRSIRDKFYEDVELYEQTKRHVE